ncbi:hypothetical protein [Sulfurovum riftiae]|uniref:Uncharacterized protein n=1 Tax=Sulfurovum riftiae TaxID=1630136 RepID=A0A151CHN2_9BACT|nr:hypothetical protein [Sulfurovum riftiae]KYJ87038.1 hypothetical protein AS592_03645 [Sulfurovum riftiae]
MGNKTGLLEHLAILMERELISYGKTHPKYEEVLVSHAKRIAEHVTSLNKNVDTDPDLKTLRVLCVALKSTFDKKDFLEKEDGHIKKQNAYKKIADDSVALSESIRSTLVKMYGIDIEKLKSGDINAGEKDDHSPLHKPFKASNSSVGRFFDSEKSMSPNLKAIAYLSFLVIVVPILVGVLMMYFLIGDDFFAIVESKELVFLWIIGYELISFVVGIYLINRTLLHFRPRK